MSDAKPLIDMLHRINSATGERWFAYRDALIAGIEQQAEELAAANEATAALRAAVERLQVAVCHLFQMASMKNEAGDIVLVDPYCPGCIDAQEVVAAIDAARKESK